jgi:hypothetical protein
MNEGNRIARAKSWTRARVGCGERREPHRSPPMRFVPQRILLGLTSYEEFGGIWGRTLLKTVLPNNRFERDAAKSAAPLKRNVGLTRMRGGGRARVRRDGGMHER